MQPAFSTNQERWRALLARDVRSSSAFVYAVRSTGVYCRPCCPSRRPSPDQVVFFSQPAEAEHAGFRPCKRCRPQDNASPQLALVDRIRRNIESNLDEPLKLDGLAASFGMSPFHLQRTFKRVMGVTPRQYGDSLRLSDFKGKLRQGRDVTSAIYDAGYGSSSRLYERAPARLGMTPAIYSRGGRGMHIRYAIVTCSLGNLLVAATDRGICSVTLGDSEQKLEASLFEEYPKALVERDQRALSGSISTLLDYLQGSQPNCDLPLDVQATAFECRVWEELRAIPYGSTRSYSEIAAAIGRPTATRAVANACAKNQVAILVPCHRAVRQDGSPGGYKWGVRRKQALLQKEGQHRHSISEGPSSPPPGS